MQSLRQNFRHFLQAETKEFIWICTPNSIEQKQLFMIINISIYFYDNSVEI